MPQVALTDRFISGVKADTRAEFFDDNPATRGLCLRVTGEGRKTWCLIYTSPRDGKRARLTLGTYPVTSLARARALAIEARGHVEAGRDPRDVEAERAAGAMSVSMLARSYLEKHARPNLRSAEELERRLERNILPIIGAVKLGELHRRDINRVIDPVLERGARTEAGRVFEDVRAMLRWAVARGDLDHNPIDGMRKPAGSAPRQRILSEDEIRTVWTGLPRSLARSPACQRIVKLCLLTLQRVGEVSGMAVAELDLDAAGGALWTIPGARTKNGYPHAVPLAAPAVALIREALADAGKKAAFVFPSGEAGLPSLAVAHTIARACKPDPARRRPLGRFGIPHWTAHDLRRTGVSGMGRLGVPPIVRGHVINHRSVTKAGVTLAVYDQYDYAAEKRDALAKWAGHVMGLVSPAAPTAGPVDNALEGV